MKRSATSSQRALDYNAVETAVIGRLQSTGKVGSAALERALRVRDESGQRLTVILARLGLASEVDIAKALSAEMNLPLADPESFPVAPLAQVAISPKFLREACILPLTAGSGEIVLAMADPLDTYAVRAVEMSSGLTVSPQVATPSDIETACDRLYGAGRDGIGELVDNIEECADEGATDDIDRLRDMASEAPVIRLVNLLIFGAVESRASDIHIEPFGSKLLVRYRIDGVLSERSAPPLRLRAAVVSRIKIMAGMNIAERRLPQDGRIRFTVRGREFDLRVSTMPTLHGEAVVMRVLDRASLVSDFGALGFAPDTGQSFLQALARPQGIVLVTGPTGSGKTTTLYTGLLQLNEPGKKLFTIEDPVEYELEGVNQVQVKAQIGLSFAQVLRATLRHDPDVVMIGEIRDLETAEVAAQAALTGHLVLSTLHTNDAASSVTRLLDMGVESYLIPTTLTAVLAQRLVRNLCPQCRKPLRDVPPLARAAEDNLGDDAGQAMYCQPVGCEACHGSGYRGRTAITEILLVNDSIRQVIQDRGDANAIAAAAVSAGMATMHADGMRKARLGLTSVEEVLRVTREN